MRRLAACLLAVFVTLVVVAPPTPPPRRSACARRPTTRTSSSRPPARSSTDVTCGGADTGDYLTGQYPGVAPQLDAVSRDTQVITMTIGGNDSGVFINSIPRCGVAG